jgi:hypothetical protein
VEAARIGGTDALTKNAETYEDRGAEHMRHWDIMRYVLMSCVAGALLAGCGGSQAPGSVPFSGGNAQKRVQSAGRPATGAGHYLYVTDGGSHYISAFAIDPSSGALTHVKGSPFSTGRRPVGEAIDPTGTFMYVANAHSDEVGAYLVHPKTGRLTRVQGSPFAARAYPWQVAIDPTGKFVYVVNYS